MSKPQIVPAIIPKDFYELEDKVAMVAGHSKQVHIDMCDGILTRSTSWPQDGDKIFEQILIGERGLPEWEDVDFEVHLMTAHPENYVFDWVMGGAYRVVVQIESFFPGFKGDFDEVGKGRLEKMLEKLKTDHGYDANNDDGFYQVGISVGIDTSLEIVKPLIENKRCFLEPLQMMFLTISEAAANAECSQILSKSFFKSSSTNHSLLC